jgi:type VI protein secretion system component VasF
MLMAKRSAQHQKRSTTRPKEQVSFTSLYVVALLFVAALVVYLAATSQLTSNAVTALGAVTAALVVMIKGNKK